MSKLAKKLASIKHWVKIGVVVFFLIFGALIIWITTFDLPNLDNFEERRVAQSTKILDRTGEIVLYDIHGDFKRTVIPLSEISENVVKATIAIEDKNFYNHKGIQFSSILRAVIKNLSEGNLLGGQGGSTITQQVIKNALLTNEKKVSRKIKEWVLAPRLEKLLTKNQILEIYLNEIPYGGNVYGIEEASLRFFGKQAKDINLAEAAYLAALPQAPTYYSPYGNNLAQLELRKNFVLDQMKIVGFITEKETEEAKKVKVDFQKQSAFGIKAPHFVIHVRELLEKEFGKEIVEQGGLRVITTLDWKLQEKAEEIVKKYALENEIKFNAENGSIVAVDPNNGEVLVMVGSRDYFDDKIQGNFNIATAERQPGSAFKPFVYAEAFNKGYRPETVVFDLETEFSVTCGVTGGNCYKPVNYDGVYRGPVNLRNALAQSLNVPAVKVLYLAGLNDSLNLAKKMGISTLVNPARYGLTLVLGGGEVKPVDMASAYGVFASDGKKAEQKFIIKIEDVKGKTIYEPEREEPERILSEQTARLINNVLSDNEARAPAFGSSSFLYIPGYDVAVKTGTTNDYRDAWIVGYTPNISVAAWAGNNDNSPMEKRVAGFIVAPMWNEFMKFALENRDKINFIQPEKQTADIKPIIAGYWKGETISVEKNNDGEEFVEITGARGGIHSILHWINKSDPLGPEPRNPYSDPQYQLWEEAVQKWIRQNNIRADVNIGIIQNKGPELLITNPTNNADYFSDSPFVVVIQMSDNRQIKSGEVYLNDSKIGEINVSTRSFDFIPKDLSEIQKRNVLRVVIKDELGNEFESSMRFGII